MRIRIGITCYYCERVLTNEGGTRSTKDHIIPITLGGVNSKVNIVRCCSDCNQLKGSKSLSQFIHKIEKYVGDKRKTLVNYNDDQLRNIIKNCESLISNCLMVFGKQLFTSKHDFEYYTDVFYNKKKFLTNDSKIQ